MISNCPTVCVTCVWAGVDSVWEQEKLEARKMLENAAEWLGFRLAANMGQLEGQDSLTTNKGGHERFRKQRNLGFKSNIAEAYAANVFPEAPSYK